MGLSTLAVLLGVGEISVGVSAPEASAGEAVGGASTGEISAEVSDALAFSDELSAGAFAGGTLLLEASLSDLSTLGVFVGVQADSPISKPSAMAERLS